MITHVTTTRVTTRHATYTHAMKSHVPRTGPRRTLAAAVATRNALPYHPHSKEIA